MSKTLLEVVTEQGIETEESSNGRRVARCPFHEGDRDPSFTLYPNETYWCFGCHVWGNPVKFLVEYKGMSAKEALDYVGHDYNLPKSEKRVIKVKNMSKTSQFLYGVAYKYHEYLISNPGPLKYLQDRGLTMETIQKYMLGYTDGGVIDFTFVDDYETANEVGLLSKSGYETMSHRITVPNLIYPDLCDFMIGRTVINDKIKYLGLRMPKPIMGFHAVRNSPVIFLVEGQFDWLLLNQWGYPTVVMSGSHITKSNLSLILGKKVIYIPDNDETGRKAALEVTRQIPMSAILDITSLGTKDISESQDKEAFDALVMEQVWPTLLLNTTLAKWLPNSTTLTPLGWT